MAKIALRGVTCFTGIHFSLGTFMTYSLKVPERSNGREYSEELVHAIAFMFPRAHPNTTKPLVPHFYIILTPVPAVVL